MTGSRLSTSENAHRAPADCPGIAAPTETTVDLTLGKTGVRVNKIFGKSTSQRVRSLAQFAYAWAALGCLLCTGCAAFHSLDGVSPDCVPQVLNIGNRSDQTTIDLALLRRSRPSYYLIDTGDVLSIYVEGGIFDEDISENALVPPPVNFPQNQNNEARPSLGYPVSVDADGMVSLPLVGRVYVRGLTLGQVQQAIARSFTEGKSLLKAGQEQIVVSLQQPRTYRVLVIRQESGNEQGNRGNSSTVNFESDKRGTGRVVHLPAYQNDVLHALAETGGLPGLDAENAIYIIRRNHLDQTCQPQQPTSIQPQPLPAYGPCAPAPRMFHSGTSPSVMSGPNQIQPVSYQPQGFGHTAIQAHYSTPAVSSRYPGLVNTPNVVSAHNVVPAQYSMPDRYSMPAQGTLPASYATTTQNLPFLQQAGHTHAGMPQPYMQPELNWPDPGRVMDMSTSNSNVLRIPLRVLPGEAIPFTESEVTLYDGDIIFIESREKEFFYTGGLLGGGQYNLPRDYDIDVLGALALAQSQNQNLNLISTKSVGGMSVINQDVSVGASKLYIFRQLPQGGTMPIEVDLYETLRHPQQKRVIIQPGDYLILKYTKTEACAAFLERHILEGAIIGGASSLISR